jgi:hypothetical protein
VGESPQALPRLNGLEMSAQVAGRSLRSPDAGELVIDLSCENSMAGSIFINVLLTAENLEENKLQLWILDMRLNRFDHNESY